MVVLSQIFYIYTQETQSIFTLMCHFDSFLTRRKYTHFLHTGTDQWVWLSQDDLRGWGVFIKDFIYLHVMLIHWDLGTDLFLERQSQGVGLHFLVLQTALQVGVIVALAPPQPVAVFVKPEAWQEDEVKSPCGNRNAFGVSMVVARSLQDSIWALFLITSTLFLISKEIYDLCEITKENQVGQRRK